MGRVPGGMLLLRAWEEGIHAICPGGTEKSQNFDPSKPVPAGRHFSCKICFVRESLSLSNALHFQTSGLAK